MTAGLLAATGARAQPVATVRVSVNATAAGEPIERVWPFFGYDEINYTTVPEGKALLDTIAAGQSAPVYVRSHFLFNTGDGTPALKWGSTNVYAEDPNGEPIYSWTLTDGILDTLNSFDAFPFVELGFMPEALSTNPTPYGNSSVTTLDGGCFYPPTDYAKWANLVREWALHALDRFPGVAPKWLWELWNEPDINYWHGTFDEYARLYDYTESALHAVIPNAPLGGPAVARVENGFLTKFLDHCASGTNAVTGATGTRLDLITFHAKGGVTMTNGHVEMDLGNQLRLHRAGFSAVTAFPQFNKTPIYITEADPDGCAACPASTVPANAYRNSPAYGAYEVAMMKRTLDLEAELGVKLGGILTWAFTFPQTPYFAGYRALATNGIQLPVLGAFKLLGRMAGARLPLTSSGALVLSDILKGGVRSQPDIDGMASMEGNSIEVLLWNYHDDIEEAAATPVHLIVNVPANFGASAHVSHLRVDGTHGNAYATWVAQGMPANPSVAQLASLQLAMQPSPLLPDETVAIGRDGSLPIDFDLPRFGISLVTIQSAMLSEVPESVPPREGCSCDVGGHRMPLGHAAALGMVLLGFARAACRRSAPFLFIGRTLRQRRWLG
ncbi:MAG TPA: hypothetical protein VIV60_29755 [Polyangiaceae bacterium]